ncbi:MAG: cytochrome c [Pirellulaceae bacterium]
MSRSSKWQGWLAIGLLAVVGCDAMPPEPEAFEPNYLYAHRLASTQDLTAEDGSSRMDQPLSDAQRLLVDWFGTPDAPKIPAALQEDDLYKELISQEHLQMAAGPAPKDTTEPGSRGLYRQFCVNCHGITGHGRGTTAASQNPYPRDFRMGVFKFKSTPSSSKPLHDDLMRILARGLPGSQMPAFDKFSQDQRKALADYVIYLSMRGEFERTLLRTAAFELDLEGSDETPPDRLYDPSNSEKVAEQLDAAKDLLTEIADKWVDAEDEVEEFMPPETLPVPGLNDVDDQLALDASIARGKELFLGQAAACSQCHGASGKGDGQKAPDFDAWAKDWGVATDIEPGDVDAIRPLLSIGAMRPQPVLPRNLVEGKFRGGDSPLDLYRRIRYGIAGTPMPAAALSTSDDAPGLKEEDLWHLVNYVKSLSEVRLTSVTPAAPSTVADEPAAQGSH